MMIGGGRRSSISNHGGDGGKFTVLVFFIVLVAVADAQPPDPQDRQQYPRFSPSMAVIVVVLVSALFFMGFFSIYIRHCSDSSGATGSRLGRGLSMRARRAAAARGLDRAILETFPTFPYAEVKDHMIGKGGLECAVCLNEFEPDETLRLLPKCDHVFHTDCIDAWLESHVTCPVCRANLSVAAEDPVLPPAAEEAAAPAADETTARNEEIVIQVATDDPEPNRNASFEYPNRPARSWSIKMLSFGKFRSHSTGHSVVQPVENLDRFTLRLPAHVRKDMIDRAMLNRTRSLAITLPRESSSRRGYRAGGGRSNRRIDVGDRTSRSDRWAFLSRALSTKSPKVGVVQESTSNNKGGPVKLPSFKCLEPKTDGADEIHLISKEPGQSPV